MRAMNKEGHPPCGGPGTPWRAQLRRIDLRNDAASAQSRPGGPKLLADEPTSRLSRHPSVLKELQPLAMAHLSSLTPRAISTLAGLLSNRSGYIRLEAAKDILNRTGVGLQHDRGNTSPLLISINIGSKQTEGSVALVTPETQPGLDGSGDARGPKSAEPIGASDLSRHPLVLKVLQPMAHAHLSSLTPRAISTLAGLLSNRSGYIRLEAAKDILNRTGVGIAHDRGNTSPLLISISIGSQQVSASSAAALPDQAQLSDPSTRPGGPKLPGEVSTRSPAHDFSPKVLPGKVSEVIDVPDEWSLD